ncbi:sensory rhodopsin transducer [Serratia marcescens]|uniref:sensory rhodopsin transducer n=1 Tax=Serratia marcescens TaxID=615 RepID=UPI0034D3DDA5
MGASEVADHRCLVYFTDREPTGKFNIEIPARRASHQCINDLEDPEKIPVGTDYSFLIRNDKKIVVQHTRLDSRQAGNALMTTMTYPVA